LATGPTRSVSSMDQSLQHRRHGISRCSLYEPFSSHVGHGETAACCVPERPILRSPDSPPRTSESRCVSSRKGPPEGSGWSRYSLRGPREPASSASTHPGSGKVKNKVNPHATAYGSGKMSLPPITLRRNSAPLLSTMQSFSGFAILSSCHATLEPPCQFLFLLRYHPVP